MTEQPKAEPIANLGITREPGYLYYIDKEGNVKRIKKTGKRKRQPKINPFKFMSSKVPNCLLDCYVSTDFKQIRRMGEAGSAYVALPLSLVGKKFRIVLIPESYYENELPKTGEEKSD